MQEALAKAVEIRSGKRGPLPVQFRRGSDESGQTDAACDAFKKAIDADPNYADAHYQYGICLTGKATRSRTGRLRSPKGPTKLSRSIWN